MQTLHLQACCRSSLEPIPQPQRIVRQQIDSECRLDQIERDQADQYREEQERSDCSGFGRQRQAPLSSAQAAFVSPANQHEIVLVAPQAEGTAQIELVPGPRAGGEGIA